VKTPFALTVLIALAMLLAACAAPAPPTPTPPPPPPPTPTPLPRPTPTQAALTPAEVVLGMAERFSAGDLEGGMAYWADDAIWYLFGLPPHGSELYKGKEALRAEFASEIADHLKVEIEIKSVVGNIVTTRDTTWMDFTRQIGVAPLEATGQFLIEDGKISIYAWTLDSESVERLKVALAEAMPELMEAQPETSAPPETPVSEITVTIAGGTCSYEGPLALQAGEVQVTMDVQDRNRDHYAVFFLTLDPDKDFMDLMAATMGAPPSWSNLLPYRDVGPGKRETYSISVIEGPLYAICASKPPDHPIGNFGPFTVISATAEASATQPAESEPVAAKPAPEIPPSDMVVTFADGGCTLNSPLNLKAGENTVTMVVEDSDHDLYAFALLNLSAGKGRRDAVRYFTAPREPAWAHAIAAHDAMPGDVKTYSVTLEAKPLYVACVAAYPDKVFGSFGPIEVAP
jgi:hypothetical protein